MGFDFENAEAFTPGLTTLLPVGNHVVKINDPQSNQSSGGYPQIELEVRNGQGSRKDWIVYGSPGDTKGFGVSKVVGLFAAAGVALSNDDQDESTGQLTQQAVSRLDGKTVGVVIREEDDRQNPGKKRERIKGYVSADQITDEVPIDTSGLGTAPATEQIADDDIPF